jgi:uncharacterized protein YbaA (DUF1428 family)
VNESRGCAIMCDSLLVAVAQRRRRIRMAARYFDGFVLPVPKKNVAAYRKMAQAAGKIWREHGCVEYRECVGEDLAPKYGVSFSRVAKVRPGETVFFSWIGYKSRAHRDKVNAKVMKDPRMGEMMKDKNHPFDPTRMAYGGFEVLVDA